MDRNYYYRVLGVRSDATPAQIKAAYDARIARLSSEDYADEPEYARRKKEQATKAYKVLTGAAPAATKAQREDRFERHKDRIERREGFEDDFDRKYSEKRESRKSKASTPKISLGKKAVQSTADKAKLSVAGTAITILVIVIGLFSNLASMFEDTVDYSDYESMQDYIYGVEENFVYYDYYEDLDLSTIGENMSKIVWDDGVDEYGEKINGLTLDVLWWVGMYEDIEEFFNTYTGIEDYYYDYDDRSCAEQVINWIGAPPFEEIVGATNLYNGEQIMSLTDYMEYLEEYTYERY